MTYKFTVCTKIETTPLPPRRQVSGFYVELRAIKRKISKFPSNLNRILIFVCYYYQKGGEIKMWRSKKFIVVALLATVLVVGSTAGVVLAQENGDDSQPKTLLARVAEKLGVELEVFQGYFAEARSEMRDERTDALMAKVAGILGIDQDTLRAAFDEARSEIQDKAPGDRQRGELMARVVEILGNDDIDQDTLKAAFAEAKREMRQEALENRLAKLVDEGRITEAQVDEYLNWLESKPDTPQFREQVKEWRQARPDLPPELEEWRQARPDVPLRHGFGGRRGHRGFGGRCAPAE
jgi:hypothetical protein